MSVSRAGATGGLSARAFRLANTGFKQPVAPVRNSVSSTVRIWADIASGFRVLLSLREREKHHAERDEYGSYSGPYP